ncbi:DUF4383 domain-containing protein [Georgenia yuyongxinii]|uniref:DUF4383 domain-containing protein n=1 Tax=Georgenia yuyongxinii TaxID=2589797 RepID=A0A5B8C394_9MICO|nr:DUF4383 domain-containing protein [Georgenia yuyongxinii]QDC23745.1 DUF4383 domain-containing protein [Georgenia yuyongxinii]
MARAENPTVRRPRGVHQWLALLVGAVFLAVGLWGFARTGLDGLTDPEVLTAHDGPTLLWFTVNPLHNIVHVVVGVLGVLLWAASATARIYGWLLFLGYGAVFVYGLFAVGNPDIDLLHLNQADNWLHLGTALVGLLIAVLPRPGPPVARDTPGVRP